MSSKRLSHKKARYIGSISSCILEEGKLYEAKKDLFVTRKHVLLLFMELVLLFDIYFLVLV